MLRKTFLAASILAHCAANGAALTMAMLAS